MRFISRSLRSPAGSLTRPLEFVFEDPHPGRLLQSDVTISGRQELMDTQYGPSYHYSMANMLSRVVRLSFLPRAIRRHLLVGAWAAAVVASASLLVVNRYTSEARLLPGDENLAMGTFGLAVDSIGLDPLGGAGKKDAQYPDILKSRWLLNQLLNKTYTYGERSWWLGSPKSRTSTLQEYLKAKNLDKGYTALLKKLTIKKDLKTNQLTISMESNSPELSLTVIQTALELLDRFLIEKMQTKAKNKINYAVQRINEGKVELQAAEDRLRQFLELNRNYSSSNEPSVRLLGERLVSELALQRGIRTQLATQFEQARLDEKMDLPTLTILDSGNLPIEKSGPSRAVWTILVFLVFGVGSYCWENRRSLMEYVGYKNEE